MVYSEKNNMKENNIISEINRMRGMMNLTLIKEDRSFEFFDKKYLKPKKVKAKEVPKDGEEIVKKEVPKKEIINFDILKKLIFTDPTTTVKPEAENLNPEEFTKEQMSNLVRIGIYSKWIVEKYLKPTDLPEGESIDQYREAYLQDLLRLKQLLVRYNKFKNAINDVSKRNILNVGSVDELINLPVGSTTLELYSGKSKEAMKKSEVVSDEYTKIYQRAGSEIVFKGSEYTVVKISQNNKEGADAASFFGGYHEGVAKGETVWCTSPINSKNFVSYITKGPLWIVLPNDPKGKTGQLSKLPAERYQFHFTYQGHGEYKDPSNTNIEGDRFSDLSKRAAMFEEGGKFGELREFMRENLAKYISMGDFETKGQSSRINFSKMQSSPTNFYTMMFGLPDLIENLPSGLKDMNWSSDSPMSIEITDSFKKQAPTLRLLCLKNVVSELPDIFQNFNELISINLEDNGNLKEIPKSIYNLPNLKILIPPAHLLEKSYQILKDRGFEKQNKGLFYLGTFKKSQ